MMTYLGMYILTKLDSWQCFMWTSGFVLIVVTGIMLFGCVIAPSECYGEVMDSFKGYTKAIHIKDVFIIGVILLILGQLLPTTKQAAFIWVAPQIIDNGAVKDTVKNIPELTKLGTEYLKELLKEKTNDIKR